jgi:hypothetical protein|nr:MAG TPA: hypothetical protein [Caudoviricetes sp.]
MAKAILMKGGSGGVTSSDVTASKAQVLQGYMTITSDSDDEIVQGIIPSRGAGDMVARPDVVDWVNSRISVVVPEGYYHGNNGNPWVWITFEKLQSLLKLAADKMLETATYLGVKGNIKIIDTKVNDYSLNASSGWGIDARRGKFWAILGHGNAYYAREDNNPHVDIPAEAFGTARADSVLQWQTASSQHGIKFEGTIPRWIATHGDVILANPSHSGQGFAYDLPNVGRCIVVGIKNGAFIQGANYVALPSPNFQPWNIRAGVNIHGITGTLQDYGAGRVAFRNATFDGVLISGVANKGFILRSIPRFLNFKNTSNGYLGIQDGGMKLLNFYGGNTRQVSAQDVGCVFAHSINLSPFRYIKVGYKVFRFIGDGTNAQPASVSFEIGVTPVSNSGGESYNSASNTVLKDIGGTANSTSHVMTSTRPSAGDQSDHSQLYLTLDVSANQGHHFLYFMLGNIIHEYGNGVVSSNVVVNYIEFIN